MTIEILKEFKAFELKISEFDPMKHIWNHELGRSTIGEPDFENKVPNHFATVRVVLIDGDVLPMDSSDKFDLKNSVKSCRISDIKEFLEKQIQGQTNGD